MSFCVDMGPDMDVYMSVCACMFICMYIVIQASVSQLQLSNFSCYVFIYAFVHVFP